MNKVFEKGDLAFGSMGFHFFFLKPGNELKINGFGYELNFKNSKEISELGNHL
jgi:hypothetical protein